MADLQLDTPVRFIRGVGPRRAQQLAGLGIETVEDLLTYYPRRFDLRRRAQPIGTLEDGQENATAAGTVTAASFQRWGRRPYFSAEIEDGSGALAVKWFNGGYLQNRIKPGLVIAVSGKLVAYHGNLQMVNPVFQEIEKDAGADLDRDQMVPVYPAGCGLTSRIIGKIVREALPSCRRLLKRWFDRAYLAARDLMDLPAAVEAMHHPEDREQWRRARRRLAYNECLVLQVGMALTRSVRRAGQSYPLKTGLEVDRRIRARFPFALTAAQDRAVGEITADIARSTPMNRLLQGDVGSGKTVVALYAALAAVAAGRQAAIMAPTEILAGQHFAKCSDYLAVSRVDIALLVGGLPAGRKQAVLGGISSGDTDIVVGTHALLSSGVQFSSLALVVVDEQHKFGVAQRTELHGKGYAPHYLVMTATPIPRTLAMTVFGDLDVSTIDQLPPGRGDIHTSVVDGAAADEVLDFVEKRLDEGGRAFFVFPLVSPSDKLGLMSATEARDALAAGPLGRFGVGLVHGGMPAEKKHAAMRAFAAGDIRVLAASSVIEVGIDISTANVIVVMHAERFGLAQLHQLRGRVGRGAEESHCILVSDPRNPIARRRLQVLEETRDGFRVAEEDLRLRGPGEFFGTRQHGMPELKVADLAEDFSLLREAREDAFAIVEEDPYLAAPHHRRIKAELKKMYGDRLQFWVS